MKSKNFIIFSSIDWGINWQLHHELVNSIINSGSNVLFIENTGSRNINLSDFQRVFSRIKNWIFSKKGYRIVNKNFLIYSPLILPFPYNYISIKINNYLIKKSITNWIKNSTFSDVALISFLPTPLISKLFYEMNSIYKIYYCADEMYSGAKKSKINIINEQKFIKNVDSVFCTSHNLLEKCKIHNKNAYLIPSGVNFLKFQRAYKSQNLGIKKILKMKKPIIGYIGAITGVFDQELLVQLANNFKNFTFILVGKTHVNVQKLKKIKNIIFIGEVSHDNIPKYLKSFDFGIIPYYKNDFTENVYSFKLNEYLAMGLPVVTTNLNEFKIFEKNYPNTIYVARNYNEFKDYLNQNSNKYKKNEHRRIEVAKENSWSVRFKKIIQITDKLYEDNFDIFLKRKNNEQLKYLNSRNILFYPLLIFIAMYIAVFNSPLFYYISKGLTVDYSINNADAIVVFSGDGDSGYENLSFQKRTLDVLKYYRSGYAKKIFISSGKEQKISQVEIIRALLMQNNVKEEDINIFTSYPSSTYENVIMVNKVLSQKNIDNIIFITAPFHSKRASLIWKKNAPQIKIYYAEPIENISKSTKILTFDQIKVVIYEYLAIIYNYFKGRL